MDEEYASWITDAIRDVADALRERPRLIVIALPSEGLTDAMVEELTRTIDELMGGKDEGADFSCSCSTN
jgi:hypothetical protein